MAMSLIDTRAMKLSFFFLFLLWFTMSENESYDGLGSIHVKFDLVGGGEKEGFNQKCISRTRTRGVWRMER